MEAGVDAPQNDGWWSRVTLTWVLVIAGLAAWLAAFVATAVFPETPTRTSLVAVVVILGLLLFLWGLIRGTQDYLKRAMVGFATTAGWTPVIAALATIAALYVVPDPTELTMRGMAIVGGIVIALFGWAILAFLGSFHNVPDKVNTRVYSDVSEAYRSLRRRFESIGDRQGTAAYRIVEAQLDWLRGRHGIGDPGFEARADADWATGYRYIDLWSAVHRAEESLIELASDEELYAEIRQDQMRLAGSTLTGVKERLDQAINAFTPLTSQRDLLASMRVELRMAADELPGNANQAVAERLNRIQERLATIEQGSGFSLTAPEGQRYLRAELRAIRHAINEFRLGRMDGLVRARNRLERTTNATAWAIFVVLVAAIGLGASRENLVAAVVFFSVGALIGLFAELRADAKRNEAVEDYGLSAVRLRQTALASGLAAVAGVILTAIAINTTGAPAGSGTQRLSAIFNAGDSPGQLLIAAVFGLSPHLLIERLTATAEKYREQLSQTAPGERQGEPAGVTD